MCGSLCEWTPQLLCHNELNTDVQAGWFLVTTEREHDCLL